jgi:hypothetical protein
MVSTVLNLGGWLFVALFLYWCVEDAKDAKRNDRFWYYEASRMERPVVFGGSHDADEDTVFAMSMYRNMD